jgi:hypothetical protein
LGANNPVLNRENPHPICHAGVQIGLTRGSPNGMRLAPIKSVHVWTNLVTCSGIN